MYDNYTFFWSGPFSQWYKSKFVVNGVTFNCAEQFMMYSKAMLFGDIQTAKKIMATPNPKPQKDLGRQVANFDVTIWNNIAKSLVYQGNMAKFTQNPKLFSVLMDTNDTLLVEASPLDAIWGIGLDEIDAKSISPDLWPGSNWLGEAITQVRDDLCSQVFGNEKMDISQPFARKLARISSKPRTTLELNNDDLASSFDDMFRIICDEAAEIEQHGLEVTILCSPYCTSILQWGLKSSKFRSRLDTEEYPQVGMVWSESQNEFAYPVYNVMSADLESDTLYLWARPKDTFVGDLTPVNVRRIRLHIENMLDK